MNETSASGSASAASSALATAAAPPSDWVSIFCGLNGGMLAESCDTESDRLPATRMNGRTRTISRLPLPRVVVETRITSRAALNSPGEGMRSVLRAALAMRSVAPATAWRSTASTRSGTVAKLVSPSSAANTAPPMSAAPHRPVRMVPLNHCTETRRRSTRPLRSPSTDNGCSLPRSMCSVSQARANASSALIQARRPLRPRECERLSPDCEGAERDRTPAADSKARHDAATSTARQRPCSVSSGLIVG